MVLEDNIKLLLDKYALKSNNNNNNIPSKYYFYYETDQEDEYRIVPDANDMTVATKKVIYIIFYDSELSEILKDICQQPELYGDNPCISLESLYYSINNLRLYHNNNTKVLALLSFTEELFKNKYTRMDELHKQHKSDFESLWYYYDIVDTVYKVKYLEEYICFKYDYFNYSDINGSKQLNLYGTVYFPNKNNLCTYEFEFSIKKFSKTKKISSFDVIPISEDNRKEYIDYGNKVLELYSKISYMHLKGYQYVIKDTTFCLKKDERVIVDYEGMEIYANPIFNMHLIDELEDINNVKDTLPDINKMCIVPLARIYNLGLNKSWGTTHVKNLSPVTFSPEPFDYLVLNNDKKDIIKSLIVSHNTRYNDIIENKGKGLVFLLYGNPGTGKTLTIEATCELLQKPLYNVNIGDLGTNPENMESILSEVLLYSKRWQAVILLDEVDIFLEDRNNSMIIRNAMVGIFLKILEYHDGIIFLTTNRLNSLDPAVKSRINVLMNYEDLNNKSRYKIWRSIIDRWELNISDKKIKELANHKFNGREIRNYTKLVLSVIGKEPKDIKEEEFMNTLDKLYKVTSDFNDKLTLYS